MCVVTACAALGIAFGSIPGVLRADQARAKLQLRAKAQAKAKPARKVVGRGSRTYLRSPDGKMVGVVVKAPAPGTIEVTGISMIGRSEPKPEKLALRLVVTQEDGIRVVDKDLDSRVVPAGEENTQKPISARVQVPAGQYEVRVFTYFPGVKCTDIHGNAVPAKDAESMRHVVVP
jgi:hypothetical protein